jgi:hypothetical protein
VNCLKVFLIRTNNETSSNQEQIIKPLKFG